MLNANYSAASESSAEIDLLEAFNSGIGPFKRELESYFWRVLEEIAARDSLTLPEMLSRLYSESIEAGHNLGNFTSFLRVCAMRYLGLQMSGDIPIQPEISIASLDADNILQNEAQRDVLNGWSLLASSGPIV